MTHGTVGRIIPNLLTLVENTMGIETMEAVDKLYDSLYAAQAITRQPLYHILLGCFGLLEGINLLKKRYEPFDLQRNVTRRTH